MRNLRSYEKKDSQAWIFQAFFSQLLKLWV